MLTLVDAITGTAALGAQAAPAHPVAPAVLDGVRLPSSHRRPLTSRFDPAGDVSVRLIGREEWEPSADRTIEEQSLVDICPVSPMARGAP